MKKKNYLTLNDEFILYCELNNIDNIEKLAIETFNRGFTILKYGETPKTNIITKEVPVEKIVEIIKEIPVEKIVEVIKEVPIQEETTIVTQEIIKEVKVFDDEKLKSLEEENKKLKEEMALISSTLEKFNKATYLKNSDLNSLYEE